MDEVAQKATVDYEAFPISWVKKCIEAHLDIVSIDLLVGHNTCSNIPYRHQSGRLTFRESKNRAEYMNVGSINMVY